MTAVIDDRPPRSLRELYFQLGRGLSAQGRHEDDVAALEHALKEDGVNPDVWEIRFQLAATHQRAGDDGRAFRVYLEAIADAPEVLGTILPYAQRLLTRTTARAEGEWVRRAWAPLIEGTELQRLS